MSYQWQAAIGRPKGLGAKPLAEMLLRCREFRHSFLLSLLRRETAPDAAPPASLALLRVVFAASTTSWSS